MLRGTTIIRGWQEPGTTLEFLINKNAYQALPDDLKKIVEVTARAINQDMLDEYMVKNVQALDVLINEHGVELKPFPEEVLAELKQLTQQLMNEKSASDPVVGANLLIV